MKNGAGIYGAASPSNLSNKLLVIILTAGLLYGLSRTLDVFAEAMCRMATGKDELTHNCE